MSKKKIINAEEPIHEFFGLSYAHYLVLPRTILQSMSVKWQKRFISMLGEIVDELGEYPENGNTYYCYLRDSKGKFVSDPLRDYERGRRRLKARV